MRTYMGCLVTLLVSCVALGQTEHLKSAYQEPPAGWSIVENHLVPMPEPYSDESRDISFCYGFSIATLINQMLYKMHGPSYQPVSMLDLSVHGTGMTISDLDNEEQMQPTPSFNDLGNPYRVSVYASLKKQVAAESCAPFDRLNILRSSNPTRSEDFKKLVMTLASPYIDQAQQTSVDFSKIAAQVLAMEPQLNASPSEIENLLRTSKVDSSESLMSLLGKIVVPQKCIENRIQLPAFQVAYVKFNPSNINTFKDYLIRTLNRDRPLDWGFCISQDCQAQHSLVISGWRKVCSNTAMNCFYQFLLRDSGDQVAEEPGDYWVDLSTMERKQSIMIKNYNSLVERGMAPNMVTNLEY